MEVQATPIIQAAPQTQRGVEGAARELEKETQRRKLVGKQSVAAAKAAGAPVESSGEDEDF